ncbi:apolipoprotein N-acyltransferase [Candidatus Liberibacter sp.]|uniref:apolipoprotein N-acyltransferase n=1 Tax=Candidatus Liberibacter sp. TaxID=34022 RepID=UPI0015F55240|nr:apolipoprotein N-acyltransferase [Candidatus Liberibacter sp.]MBA5724104.1 apolipoprotein N-acyltransferase [Candidatus Liberibacter sp.]
MEHLAGKVMLFSGIRRYFLAILAGACGSFALPPCDFFGASFVSFTFLVWLLDGVSYGHHRAISRFGSSFSVGWLFGIGYFFAGVFWLREEFIAHINPFFPVWVLVIFFISIPIFLALFYGIATFLALFLWSEGIGRICILACSFGLLEWLRSWILGGITWNYIGYAAMPIPIMIQSVHLIGLFGMNALSVFCFSSPALFGTRQDVGIGIGIASALLILHILYGIWALSDDLNLSRNIEENLSIIRIVQPSISQNNKENHEKILEKYLTMTASSIVPGDLEPSVIVWSGMSIPFVIEDNPRILSRIADYLKDRQMLVAGFVRKEEGAAMGTYRYYKSVYVIDNKGKIVAKSDKKDLIPFAEYLPHRNLLKGLGFNFSRFPEDYSAAQSVSILALSEKLRFYPIISSEGIFYQNINKNSESANAILNIVDDFWCASKAGSYQNFRYAKIHAVETGLPLVRVKNNGISAFIDAKGRVMAFLGLGKGASIDMHFRPAVTSPTASEKGRVRFFWIIEFILLVIAFIASLVGKRRIREGL